MQGAEPTVRVSSSAEMPAVAVRTIAGDYKEAGAHHGRKFYKKTLTPLPIQTLTAI